MTNATAAALLNVSPRAVAMGEALEELEKPKAAARKARPGQTRSEKFPGRERGRSREIIGKAIGMSGRTSRAGAWKPGRNNQT